MKKFLLLAFITLAHAEESPVSSFQTNLDIPNGCCIKSIAFEDALRTYDGKASMEAATTLRLNSDRWVKVLIVGFMAGEKLHYHALCVFAYNDGIWLYDPNYGTYRLSSDEPANQDPMTLATKWKPSLEIVSASFANPEAKNVAASTVP